MVFLDNFSKNVRRIYMEQGLTQEQAATLCVICKQYFGRILSGKSVPSLAIFMNICIGFGVSPHEMLGHDPAEFEALCIARLQEIAWRPIQK